MLDALEMPAEAQMNHDGVLAAGRPRAKSSTVVLPSAVVVLSWKPGVASAWLVNLMDRLARTP